MLKTVMLVSAFALSAPALAQDQTPMSADQVTTAPAKPEKGKTTEPADTTNAPTSAATNAPIPGTPVTDSATAAPAEQTAMPAPQTAPGTMPIAPTETATAPAAPATPADPSAAAPTETAVATATPAEPATGSAQIADVVNTEFPTYDKNADTNLDKTEFGAWMVALKTASDPTTKPGDPATVKWVDGAFASADLDKSKLVSKDELTKYLSQGAE